MFEMQTTTSEEYTSDVFEQLDAFITFLPPIEY